MKNLLREDGADASPTWPQDAARQCRTIALAVPWPAAQRVLSSEFGDLTGKILLDCTNPIRQWPEMDFDGGVSGGERVAKWARGARVVKIFNCTGAGNMANPR
jgi:predicted dinucleotide-binding enzyme